MSVLTADLSDRVNAQVLDADFKSYGGVSLFGGQIETLRASNSHAVRAALAHTGDGRVLVVEGPKDGAVVGYRSAELAHRNDWRGIVVLGRVRDVEQLGRIGVGVVALGSTPRRAPGDDHGEGGGSLTFGDVEIQSGKLIYADPDGVVVA